MSSDVATSVRVSDLPTPGSFTGRLHCRSSARTCSPRIRACPPSARDVRVHGACAGPLSSGLGFPRHTLRAVPLFAFGPHAVVDHLKGLARRDVREHAGHTPAGSWAIWLMLLLALITAVSGYLYFNEIGGEAMEEVHEVAANAWLLVVFVHVAGVIVSSVAERQNLARAMVTGYKRLGSAASNVRNASMIGVLMLAGIGLFWGATTLSGRAPVLPSWAGTHALVESPRLSSDHDSDDD